MYLIDFLINVVHIVHILFKRIHGEMEIKRSILSRTHFPQQSALILFIL